MPLQDDVLFWNKTTQQIQSKIKYNTEHVKIRLSTMQLASYIYMIFLSEIYIWH